MANPSSTSAKKMRFLILDDESQLIHLFELCIHEWFKEVDVLSCSNGDEAWLEFERQEPTMFIMDWAHPGMDGQKLLENLAAKPARCVVLLTSDLYAGQLEGLVGKGLKVGYLPKPFGVQQFWRALNDFVGPSDFPERQAMLPSPT